MMRKVADALGVAVAEITDSLSLESTTRKLERLPDYLSDEVIGQSDFAAACRAHDLKEIFRVAVRDARFTLSHLARRCEMSIGQVNAYMRDGRRPTAPIIIRVADGLHIPGEMFGISQRPWESNLSLVARPTIVIRNPEAAPDGDPVASLVEASRVDASELIMSAGQEQINPLALEQIFEEIQRLSVAYIGSTVEANRTILQKATVLRSALKKFVTAYRKPSQAADIYVMLGLLSGICAYACLDLDHPDEAMTQARASFIMGDLADHNGLRAWALGTRSLIARFQNQYTDALTYAREGLQYATSGTALVRLRCGEGQTLAHMGDAAGAIEFLNLAKDAREQVDSPDMVSGLFAFSEAKQTYYTGSSLQWLPGEKNASSAEAESTRAIQMFENASAESRSPGDVLLAHIYLGNSRLTLGQIEGSIEALRPVLDLPLSSRSSWQRKRMRQIALRLERGKFSDSSLAISAREEITSFARDS
jgi:transcriptional regulator with XRE-family HTH domain